MSHEAFMRRALDLALRAEGRTSPNPMVGAVLVKDGRIIGEGFHQKAGGPHAEIECLNAAAESPVGADMYVSLEPCCHHGKTPPCSQALIEARVRRVYYAVADDNPRVSGGGHRQLVAAGIEAHKGLLEAEGRFINRAFFRYITSGRPHVTAKYAMTLDGRIATVSGESQWITGPQARAQGHHLRRLCDAVVVGAGTVLADDPRLTYRGDQPEPTDHPVRVVLDSHGRLPLERAVFSPELPGETWVITTDMPETKQNRLTAQGVAVHRVGSDGNGHVAVDEALKLLAAKDIVRVMVEGGAAVLGSLLDAGLVDETWCFIGAKMVGGQTAPGPFGGAGFDKIDQAVPFQVYETQGLGPDVLIKARVV